MRRSNPHRPEAQSAPARQAGCRVGLIVNPVAGLGGRVGLKGSDGAEIQQRARALGARPQAMERAILALQRLRAVPSLEIVAAPGEMGEDAAKACDLPATVVGAIEPGRTTPADTRAAAQSMQAMAVDLLLFAGGDGTARDIYQAIGQQLPALGIPAGVKIHSAAYATNPVSAGDLAALYLQGRTSSLREAEVMDIDEEAVRQGVLAARLYGYLLVPFRTNLVQHLKVASTGEEVALAAIGQELAELLRQEQDCLAILGPGTTTRAIAEEMGLPKTLIGVDVLLDGRLLAADANEAELLQLIAGRRAKIVVTPIGGQGYLFGRGNQQISPAVIRQVGRQNVIVISTPDKLQALGTQTLLVDTGDPEVDEMLSGYMTIVTGYRERAVRRVSR